MFQMMNDARIGCGVQALGLTASAYDTARKYARERVQGPLFSNRNGGRVPIIQHEDVRRMLMNLKSGTEAIRAMIGKLMYYLDVAQNESDEAKREEIALRTELLTPLVKAYSSDFGYLLIRDAIQIMGGVGFCSEFPVEQYARDMKIISIWEGTSYIQSLDLVGRKLGMKGGSIFRNWIQEIVAFTKALQDDADFGSDAKLLYKASRATGDFTMKFLQYFQEGRLSLIPLISTRFLECFAETAMAHFMLEQGLIARKKLSGVDAESADGLFYRGKIETVRFFCRNILPNVFARHIIMEQEDTSAMDIPEEVL
jgi:hypothetical protein